MIFDSTPPRDYALIPLSKEFPGITWAEIELAVRHMRGLSQSKAKHEPGTPVLPEWPKPIIGGDSEMNERINALTHAIANVGKVHTAQVTALTERMNNRDDRVQEKFAWLQQNLDALRQTLAEAGRTRCLRCGEGECEC